LTELEDVALWSRMAKLAHAVVEIFEGIDDCGFVFQSPPEFLNIFRVEVEGTGEWNSVEGLCAVAKVDSISVNDSLP
jgi:hypothetical protein